jgi:hypothetical protein
MFRVLSLEVDQIGVRKAREETCYFVGLNESSDGALSFQIPSFCVPIVIRFAERDSSLD